MLCVTQVLAAAGGVIFIVLGALHAIYTALDVVKPRRFAPVDMSLLESMKKTTVRLNRSARNFWLSYLGFNFSHSLGALLFGSAALGLAMASPVAWESTAIAGSFVSIALVYALLSYCFWFWIPLVGSLSAAALFAAAWLL
jgi:hypothetical protein